MLSLGCQVPHWLSSHACGPSEDSHTRCPPSFWKFRWHTSVTPNLSDSLKAGSWTKPLVYEMTISRCLCACAQTKALCTSQKTVSRLFQKQALTAGQWVRWNREATWLWGYLNTTMKRQLLDPQLLIRRPPSSLPTGLTWLNKMRQYREGLSMGSPQAH